MISVMVLMQLIAGGMCIISGVVMYKFKLSSMIAGYNTSSHAEKNKWNEEKLVKGVSATMVLMGVPLLLSIVWLKFSDVNEEFIILISWGVWLAVLVAGRVVVWKKARF